MTMSMSVTRGSMTIVDSESFEFISVGFGYYGPDFAGGEAIPFAYIEDEDSSYNIPIYQCDIRKLIATLERYADMMEGKDVCKN